jgi:hypothetical protein
MIRNSGFFSETKLSFCLTATLWRLIESGVTIIGLKAVGKKIFCLCRDSNPDSKVVHSISAALAH